MTDQSASQNPPAPKKRSKLKTILLVILAIIVVFCIVVAMQPADFKIERSATINAPADVVFAQVNDLKKWQAWSPWEGMDPNMQRRYESSPAGNGAMYHWKGNNDVGEGRMTIVESKPAELIRIKLEFLKPFAATNEAKFAFKPEAAGTNVNWSMTGHKNFMMKAVCMFMNMDKMVGDDFEKGLAKLKSVSESAKP